MLTLVTVYVTLHKPKFTGKAAKKVRDLTEDFHVKFETYAELAKLFIQDKFNIDLSKEEEQRKLMTCAFLVALLGILVFLYGKKVLGGKTAPEEGEEAKEENIRKSVETFIEQSKVIIKKIAPTVYTSLITLLVSKKLLALEEQLELPEGEEEFKEVAHEGEGNSDENVNGEPEASQENPAEETPK